MSEYIAPSWIEFSRKVYMENITNKLIIDFRKGTITSKSIYRDASKAVISDYIFEDNTIETDRKQLYDLMFCLNLDNVQIFLNNFSRNKTAESGYREYTETEYIIDYGSDVMFSGSLREMYKNSPFEEAIAILKTEFDFVKNVDCF